MQNTESLVGHMVGAAEVIGTKAVKNLLCRLPPALSWNPALLTSSMIDKPENRIQTAEDRVPYSGCNNGFYLCKGGT
jgi:hypothetical protein